MPKVKTIVAVFVVVATLAIAVVTWLWPILAEKREFQVSLVQSDKILSTPEVLKEDSLRFIYQNEEVNNLVYSKVRFLNSGNQPLQEADFLQGFHVILPSDSNIIQFDIHQVEPLKTLQISSVAIINKVSSNELTIFPKLINPGDILDLMVLTTRDTKSKKLAYDVDDILFDYKIYGVSRIDIVGKILTNGEKRLEAREKLRYIANRFVKLGVPVLILFVIVFLAKYFFPRKIFVFLEKYLDKYIVPLFIITILGVLIFSIFYPLLSAIYHAFFLST